MRGFGKRQFRDRVLTYQKIVSILYLEPCTYTELWKKTKIHRNTLNVRLTQLVSDNLLYEHKYQFKNRLGYTNRRFYLLNGTKKFCYIFRGPSVEYRQHKAGKKVEKEVASFIRKECNDWLSNWESLYSSTGRYKWSNWQFDFLIYLKTFSFYTTLPYKKTWDIMLGAGF